MAKKSTRKNVTRKQAARKRSKAVEAAERLVAAARQSIKRPEIEPPLSDVESVKHLGRVREDIVRELQKAIVGMEPVIDELLVAFLARGHVLLDGVPGLGKSRLMSSLAQTLSLNLQRVAFTPDFVPPSLSGGADEDPAAPNILLAEEIDRGSPHGQAVLLDAMEAAIPSADDDDRDSFPHPFFVAATRNPERQEIGAPLSESQLDRFMCNLAIEYPEERDEIEMLRTVPGNRRPVLRAVVEKRALPAMQDLVDRVPVSDHLVRYAATLVRSTRPAGEKPAGFVRDFVAAGCGPRASLDLITAAKARAILHGRFSVALDDVRQLARPVLRHRLALTFTAHSEGVDADHVISRLLEEMPGDQALSDETRSEVAGS